MSSMRSTSFNVLLLFALAAGCSVGPEPGEEVAPESAARVPGESAGLKAPAERASPAGEARPEAGDGPLRQASEDIWKYLGPRYDADGDGAITRAEYPRGDVRFAWLDRNGDGKIRRADFEIHHHQSLSHRTVWAAQTVLVRYFQRDDDRAVLTVEEVRGAFAALDRNGDRRLTVEDAAESAGDAAPSRRALEALIDAADRTGDGGVTSREVIRFFLASDIDGDGRLTFRRSKAGVDPGRPAPGFSLPPVGRGENVSLASLRGRPVALVFGCFT